MLWRNFTFHVYWCLSFTSCRGLCFIPWQYETLFEVNQHVAVQCLDFSHWIGSLLFWFIVMKWLSEMRTLKSMSEQKWWNSVLRSKIIKTDALVENFGYSDQVCAFTNEHRCTVLSDYVQSLLCNSRILLKMRQKMAAPLWICCRRLTVFFGMSY